MSRYGDLGRNVVSAMRGGKQDAERREDRAREMSDRKYQDRLKEASGKIVSMPGITGDQVLALAAEYELNPMDIYKVLSVFKAVQHQNAQMDEFSKSAAYNEQVRAHNVGQNQRTVEKQGLADNLMADIATREQGLGGMGGLQPAGMPMNPAEEGRDAGITQRSDRGIADQLVRRGIGADMDRGDLGALAETLGLPNTPGVGAAEKKVTMYKINPDGSVVHQDFSDSNISDAIKQGWNVGRYTAAKADKKDKAITGSKVKSALKVEQKNRLVRDGINTMRKKAPPNSPFHKLDDEEQIDAYNETIYGPLDDGVPKKGWSGSFFTGKNAEIEESAEAIAKVAAEHQPPIEVFAAFLKEKGYSAEDVKKIMSAVHKILSAEKAVPAKKAAKPAKAQ